MLLRTWMQKQSMLQRNYYEEADRLLKYLPAFRGTHPSSDGNVIISGNTSRL